MVDSYWTKNTSLSRRALLRAGGLAGIGVAGAALIGCGDDDDDDTGAATAAPASTKAAAAATTATTAEAATPTASQIIGDNWGVREDVVPVYGGTLNYAAGSPVLANLDPIHSGSAMVHQVASNAYSSMMRVGRAIDDRNSPIYYPDIALSWEIPEPTRMVFNLRPGVKFHNVAPTNGRDFTAEDAKFAITRSATEEISRFRGALREITDVETPDDSTVVVNLGNYDPLVFNDLAGHYVWMTPKELADSGDIRQKIVGTGPFIFQKWEEDTRIQYKKNPDFYLPGVPFVDELNVLQIGNRETRIAAFESGEVVLGGVDIDRLGAYENDPDILIEEYLSVSPFVLFMKYGDPRWDDDRVRKAISLAIDPEIIIGINARGFGMWRGVISNQHGGWTLSQDELKSDRYFLRQNVQEAKQLLDAAGHSGGLDTGMLFNTSYSQYYQDGTQYLQQALKEVGINVRLDGEEHASMRKNQDEHNYDGLVHGLDGQPQAESYLLDYRTGGPKNGSGISIPWLDDKIDATIGTVDLEERQGKAIGLTKEILDQVLWKVEFMDSTAREARLTSLHNWLGAPPHWYVTSGFAYSWLDA